MKLHIRRLILALFLAFGLAPWAISAADCDSFQAAIPTEPSGELILETEDELPVAILSVNPLGITNLQVLEDLDAVWVDSRNSIPAWDHIESHGWKGAEESDLCVPRQATETNMNADYLEDGVAWIDSKYGDGWNRRFFIFPEKVEADRIHYDVVIEMGQETGRDLAGYYLTFGCPTPLARVSGGTGKTNHWYLNSRGELTQLPSPSGSGEKWITHPKAASLLPTFPPNNGKAADTWKYPLLVSEATPGGWRTITLMDPATAGAIGVCEGSEIRYVLFAGKDATTLKSGEPVVARVRHCLLRSEQIPTQKVLEALQEEFEADWEELDSLLMTFVD